MNLQKLNKASVCLIPREKDAVEIKKLRPISLLNCSLKIISQVLTNRLGFVMHKLIDNTQSAFLKNRFILDNVVLSNEIIHHCKKTKQQGVVIKIDWSKAYDRINWQYLIEILRGRGFGEKWIQWITNWLTSSQTCINIKGQLTPYFLCKRGVRQGDPLSPFLYILAADTLSKLFSKGRHANKILGLGPPCLEKRAITNCHYADDTILFLEANPRNVEITWWTMILFEALSGIKINMSLNSYQLTLVKRQVMH